MITRAACLPSLIAFCLLAPSGCSSSRDARQATLIDKKSGMNGTCPTNSGFVGDDLCLAPPDPSDGFQLHYGPSDYDDPEEVAKFTLKPSEETNDCFLMKSPNTEDAYYSGFNFQMRPGSHHLIGQSREEPAADGLVPCEGTDMAPTGLFGGSQFPKLDARSDPAPENRGFGRKIPAHTQAVINFHVVNASPEDRLREAWLNYYYIQPGELTAARGAVNLMGGMGFDITPGTHQTYRYSCSPAEPVRLLNLTAHMHAHARRMSIWKTSGDAKQKLLDEYSWADPSVIFFDSAHTNAPSNPDTETAGGEVSGDVILQPTDTIQWECDVNNDSNVTLTFRNEVFTGEMCIVAGTVVSADDPTTVVDFTCNRD